jgi:type VI protein secretion system component Hcp
MALEQFIEIPGIVGEASAPDVRGAIPVLSWSFAVQHPVSPVVGGVPADGETDGVGFSGFRFIKRVDSTTPLLLALCAKGVATAQAKLVVRSTGHRDPRIVVDLREVQVAEVSTGFEPGGVDLVESVALRFGRVWFGGAVIDRRGTSEQMNWFAWDVGQGQPISAG